MQQVITNCRSCPLYSDVYGDCWHPSSLTEGKMIEVSDSSSPDWCPLNKEPLIITKPTNTKTQTYMTIKPDENE